jgi:cytochrome c556
MSVEHIGQMPADGAFVMMTQVCSACHDRFREEK